MRDKVEHCLTKGAGAHVAQSIEAGSHPVAGRWQCAALCTRLDRAYATVMGHSLHSHDAPDAAGDDPRLEAGAYQPPLWVVKASMLAAVLVVAVPILLLTLAAMLAGVLVFLVLAAGVVAYRRLRGLRRWLGGGRPGGWRGWRDDGRRNVRVIDRGFHHS